MGLDRMLQPRLISANTSSKYCNWCNLQVLLNMGAVILRELYVYVEKGE